MNLRYLSAIATLSLPFVHAAPAFAEETAEPDVVIADRMQDEYIVVVASGRPEPITDSGQPLAVMGEAELRDVQGPDLTRALERLPGVTITRNGGLGGFTGVRVRGADAEQLLVLVDGVRAADVSSPGGGFDFGNLLAGTVGKIELVRGSNSVVWGSQAIGGVMAVTTRRFRGVEASAEYGAYDTFYGTVAAGFGRGPVEASIAAGYARSDGFSALSAGTEPDGFRQWQVSGRTSAEVAPGLRLRAEGRWADSKLDLDFFGDSPDVQSTRDLSGRAGLEYSAGALDLDAGFALATMRRNYDHPVFGGYGYNGRNARAELTGRWRFSRDLALTFGGERVWTRYDGTYDVRQQANTASGHALLSWEGPALRVSAGVRLDHHDRFGDAWTTGADASLALGGEWRLRASWGEGFKAPTLYQFYSMVGNAGLVPERSRSVDAALEYGNRNDRLHAALTLFRRDSRDLIDFVSCFGQTTGICTNRPYGTYDNVSRARAEGFELELGAAMTDRLSASAAYAWTKAVNRVTGRDLARRPRHALTIAADWRTPLSDLALGADVRMVGDSFDDAANTVEMEGHVLLTLRASLPLGERFELFGRVENVGDVSYETAAGFATPGRSAYAGVRARF